MGDPDLKFGMPRMLEVLLRERFPDRRVEVINTAVVAINSHVILPIARECAERQGDLWVIYLGNNEMVGPFGAASVFGSRTPALPLVRAGLWLKTTRVGQALDALTRLLSRRNLAPAEWTGMEMISQQRVQPGGPAASRVYRNLERNLAEILAAAPARLPILLCTVAANLRDCAPFASLHKPGLTAIQLADWQVAYDAGIAHFNEGRLTNALTEFAKAAAIDADYAELCFRQAECLRLSGLSAEAAGFYLQACSLDALPFRADTTVNSTIKRMATDFEGRGRGVKLLDAETLFGRNSPQGLTGAEDFYEHVHLTPDGNYLLALALAEQAVKMLALESSQPWVSKSECLRLLGFTDWNRYDAFNTILERIQSAPFTNQLDHARQLQTIEEQLAHYRLATKPAQLRRQSDQVRALLAGHPEDADLRWNLATLLQNSGDYPGAEEQWRALLQLQPKSALPPYNLAKLLDTLGRPSEALPLYQLSSRLDPSNSKAQARLKELRSGVSGH